MYKIDKLIGLSVQNNNMWMLLWVESKFSFSFGVQRTVTHPNKENVQSIWQEQMEYYFSI